MILPLRILHAIWPWTGPPPMPRQQRLERCLIHGGPCGEVAPGVYAWSDGRVTIRHAAAERVQEAMLAELHLVPPDPWPNAEQFTWTTRRGAAALLGPGANDDDGRYWRLINTF